MARTCKMQTNGMPRYIIGVVLDVKTYTCLVCKLLRKVDHSELFKLIIFQLIVFGMPGMILRIQEN